MIISGRKYSSKGSIRYGSSIFINDSYEKISDSLRGYTTDGSIKYVLLLLIILKFIAGNGIGMILAFTIFYVTYLITVRNLQLQFTDERLLIISEYRYQRAVYSLGWVFIGISLYSTLNFLFPNYTKWLQTGLQIMEFIFEFFGFLPVFFVAYSQTILSNKDPLIRLDSLVTFVVYFFYGVQFLKMRYHFHEIHYSHVSEQIIKVKRRRSSFITPLIIITALSSQLILFGKFDFMTSLIFFTIFLYTSSGKVASLSLFGSYGRTLIEDVNLPPEEFFRTTRATASIFGWEHQGNYNSRPFPYNVIPKEVASHYETGLRASTIDALKQANNLGLVLSGFINTFVIILLLNFAYNKNQDAIPTVIFIGIGLIFISYLVWQIASQFTRYQYKLQREESLMIGRNFIGRYIEPNLWIIRGNKLEGTSLRRGVKNRTVSYDKTRGLLISWQSLTVNIFLIIMIVLTIIWIQLGGLNLENVYYIFPFVFDLSLNFLSNKLSAELGFFILAGYLFWGVLYFNYPKYYARSRPQLFLEMHYPASIPIILKNFKEHRDASIQFTKCLINASRPPRRKTKGRPGTFLLKVVLVSIELTDKSLENHMLSFEFGENKNKGESVVLGDYGSIKFLLIDGLRVSGELGFPRLSTSMSVTGDLLNASTKMDFDLEINLNNTLTISIKDKMTATLSVNVETMIL
ncbi:MAG: hypothetical protein ACW99Q_03000 [Candidatus Kariarchaeaceae archaeon]|jgi:hypothetical protein